MTPTPTDPETDLPPARTPFERGWYRTLEAIEREQEAVARAYRPEPPPPRAPIEPRRILGGAFPAATPADRHGLGRDRIGQRIMKALRSNDYTASELGDVLQLSPQRVGSAIAHAKAKGFVVVKGRKLTTSAIGTWGGRKSVFIYGIAR